MSDTLEPTRIMLDGMDETPIAIPFPFEIGEYIIRDPDEWNWFRRHYAELEALAASRLELAKVVDRHRKDRMHSDMKLGWKMAKEIIAQAKELGDER